VSSKLARCLCLAHRSDSFYRDTDGKCLLPSSDLGQRCASEAGRLALSDVEDPSEEHVVTFVNLTLFWYAQGSWRRSFMFKGKLQHMHSCSLLTDSVVGLSASVAHLFAMGRDRASDIDTLEAEIRRRRFWACYLVHCHTAESNPGMVLDGVIENLSLPWSQDDFNIGRSMCSKTTLKTSESTGGIFCEVVKGLSFW
jgi:hypothetical protein